MEIEFTDERIGTSQLYIADAMEGEYDPPGVRVHKDENGVRYMRVRKEVGEKLLNEHIPDHARERIPDQVPWKDGDGDGQPGQPDATDQGPETTE